MAARSFVLALSANTPRRLSDAYGGPIGAVDAKTDLAYRFLVLSAIGADVQLADASGAGMNYPATILADSPLGYWRLNEAGGAAAFDSSGNNHPGTYAGGVTLGQPGAVGDGSTSALFDGSTGKITTAVVIPSFPSVEAWIYRTGPGTGAFGRITTTVSQAHFPMDLGVTAAGNFQFFIQFSDSSSFGWQDTGILCTLNTWIHVALTLSGGVARFYRNGQLVYSTAVGSLLGTFPGESLQWNLGTGPQAFQGRFDEVAIYTGPLSPSRIAAHYAASWQAFAMRISSAVGAIPLQLGEYDSGPLKLSNFSAIGGGATLSILGIPY